MPPSIQLIILEKAFSHLYLQSNCRQLSLASTVSLKSQRILNHALQHSIKGDALQFPIHKVQSEDIKANHFRENETIFKQILFKNHEHTVKSSTPNAKYEYTVCLYAPKLAGFRSIFTGIKRYSLNVANFSCKTHNDSP